MSADEHLSEPQFSNVRQLPGGRLPEPTPPSAEHAHAMAHLTQVHGVAPEQASAEMDHAGLDASGYHQLLHEADEGYGTDWRHGAQPHGYEAEVGWFPAELVRHDRIGVADHLEA